MLALAAGERAGLPAAHGRRICSGGGREPFSFADPDDIRCTLEAAGFGCIVIRAYDEMVSSGDLDAMTVVLLSVGALGKIIRENPVLRTAAEARLRDALTARGDPSRVQLQASVWIVSARAGAADR